MKLILKCASEFVTKAVFSHLQRPCQKVSRRLGERFLGHSHASPLLISSRVYYKCWFWESFLSHSSSYRHRSGLSPGASVAGAATAGTQPPGQPPHLVSRPAGPPLWPLPPWNQSERTLWGTDTLSLPPSWGWTNHLGVSSRGKAVQSREHPWREDLIYAEAEGSSRRSWWIMEAGGASVSALCVVSPDEQRPLNPRVSAAVPGQLRLRYVQDGGEGLPNSRAQSPFWAGSINGSTRMERLAKWVSSVGFLKETQRDVGGKSPMRIWHLIPPSLSSSLGGTAYCIYDGPQVRVAPFPWVWCSNFMIAR